MNDKETLEEAAERLYPIILEDDGWDKNKQYRDEWIEGAKWQKEKHYSEEEVIELLKTFDKNFNSGIVERNKGIKKWFEQFKKK